MESQTKNCQNCKKDFTIEPEDFLFYEKIKVPPPTFCFDCRSQRRMMFRNERVLHKRKNDAPLKDGEVMISIYRPDSPVTVYDDRTWWGDSWDPFDYGQGYDFSKTFFEQFKHLYRKVPLIGLSVTNNSNCTYCNVSEGDKGSHMLSGSEHNEDTIYGNRVVENKQSGDLYVAFQNELCYELINCTKCYRTLYSMNSQECVNSYFLFNSKNCNDCLGCVNLRNGSYCIFNQQYTKEEYEIEKKKYSLDTRSGLESFKEKFQEFYKNQFFKYANNIKSDGSTGDNLNGVTRSSNTFDFQEAEDLKNCFWGLRTKDSYDAGPGIGMGSELLYDVLDILTDQNVFFSNLVYNSFDVRYSINCHTSSHLFGCYGLRSKQYCILNKQYTKEEYEELIPKIISHMNEMPYIDSKGRIFKYGEFFPYDVSPFAYNETIAQEYFPLKKENATKNGFSWFDGEERNYKITILNENIPQSIEYVSDSILDEIIECKSKGDIVKQCTQAFRLTNQELQLYKKLGVPIPTFCYNCRHYNRLQQRNPMKLWNRKCDCSLKTHNHAEFCENTFETSYAPDQPEIIYCESCYQKEVL
jgi:hypothetical protein